MSLSLNFLKRQKNNKVRDSSIENARISHIMSRTIYYDILYICFFLTNKYRSHSYMQSVIHSIAQKRQPKTGKQLKTDKMGIHIEQVF